MDDTNQKTKSEMEKQIDDFFSEIRDIVIKSKDKDEAKENLEKFRNRQPDIAGSLNDVFELAEDYIEDGVNSSEQQKNFLTELDELKEQKKQDVKSIGEDIIQQGIHSDTVAEISKELGYDETTINEVLQDEENGVNIDEDVTNDIPEMAEVSNGPYKLQRPDKEKIKQLYKYKVEGKITSGIKDLDTFLGIIQPAINQLVIGMWKPIFWAMDQKNLAFENLEAWQKRKKDLAEGWKTLQAMGAVSKDQPFRWGQNIEEQENEMAGYFNKYMCDKMNLRIQQNLLAKQAELEESYKGQPEANKLVSNDLEKYMGRDNRNNRTDLFDSKKSPHWSRVTIDSEFLNLLKLKDKDGKVIARDDKGALTKDGKNLMKGYSILLDLFNKKNKASFVNNFTLDIHGLMEDAGREEWELEEKRGIKRIEDMDMDIDKYMKLQDEEAKEAEKMRKQASYYNFGNSK